MAGTKKQKAAISKAIVEAVYSKESQVDFSKGVLKLVHGKSCRTEKQPVG